MNKMVKYCKNDVILLEEVFTKFRPYIKPKVNYNIERGHCPECGSDNLVINKTTFLPSGNKKVQFRCKGCASYHVKTIIEPKK